MKSNEKLYRRAIKDDKHQVQRRQLEDSNLFLFIYNSGGILIYIVLKKHKLLANRKILYENK